MRPLCLAVMLLTAGALHAQKTPTDSDESLTWLTDYDEAIAEARRTGKPIFLEFRCVPCVNGREFDARVFYTKPDSPRGRLMSQYVLARINTMTGIDIAHFNRDWHNSLYYFLLNADEDIYLRYGGRDGTAADAYLNYESLEQALTIGLDEHAAHLAGNRTFPERKPRLVPEDYTLLRTEVIEKGRCTECHLIADFSVQEKEMAGLLDPITDLYRSPDLRHLGIELEIPKGLVLAKSSGSAAEAGLRSGDKIVAFNRARVLTFGDLQHEYDKVPRRTAESIAVSVERDGNLRDFSIPLPFEWWKSDLGFRHWTAEPQLFFESQPLDEEEKAMLHLPKDGFAARVTGIDIEAVLSQFHRLEIGDVITAVNYRKSDPLTTDLSAHITIRHSAGDELRLTVLRGMDSIEITLKTQPQNFRKSSLSKEETGIWVQWSEPDFVTKGAEKILRYRAAIANGHLLVEARHEPGWRSYAMDNPFRSREISNRDDGRHELPTKIEVPDDLKSAGQWRQSNPTDYSKPDIHWYTFGFEGTSYFALPLEDLPSEAFSISVSSQVCDADSCAGTFDLQLTVPAPESSPENLFTNRIIEGLDPVRMPK